MKLGPIRSNSQIIKHHGMSQFSPLSDTAEKKSETGIFSHIVSLFGPYQLAPSMSVLGRIFRRPDRFTISTIMLPCPKPPGFYRLSFLPHCDAHYPQKVCTWRHFSLKNNSRRRNLAFSSVHSFPSMLQCGVFTCQQKSRPITSTPPEPSPSFLNEQNPISRRAVQLLFYCIRSCL